MALRKGMWVPSLDDLLKYYPIMKDAIKLARYASPRVGYGWAVFRFKLFQKLTFRSFVYVLLIHKVQESRLSPLFPLVRFFANSILRTMWLYLSPSSMHALWRISQHKHGNRDHAMSVARRSHEILVQEVRHLPRDWYDDNFWVGKYVMFAGTFQLACDSIVDPNPKFDQALNGLRDTFRKASTLESMFPPSTRT